MAYDKITTHHACVQFNGILGKNHFNEYLDLQFEIK